MHEGTDLLRGALDALLKELFDGSAADAAYVLNPGDVGLLRQLDDLDAATASARLGESRSTIAAHADHLVYGLDLLNRWAAGEPKPWAEADWEASWRRATVTDEEWGRLCQRLREAASRWRDFVASHEAWDPLAATGALASAVHTGYHLGAIRQIVASVTR